jgi:raffinose/stachyose/melibiose transport system substrate-binding protein
MPAGIGFLFIMLTSCVHLDVPASDLSEQETEPIVLRYSSFLLDSAQAGDVYHNAVAEFESRYPHIRIDRDFIPNTNYTAGIKTRLLGGEKLDVFDVWSPSLFEEFRKLGDVYLDLSGEPFLDEFLSSSLAPVTVNGKVFGVPEVMHSDGLLYNRTLFENLGLSVPQKWDEFIELCETLKARGIIPIAFDSEWWGPQFFFGSIMSNNGADAAWTEKLERGEVKVRDPIFVDAMRKTRELIDRGYVPPDWLSLRREQSKDMIGEGKAAMMIAGTWDMPSIIARNPDHDVDFMMVPGTDRTVPNINIGTYRVIHAGTEYPEEAKLFVAFMNGRANQEKLALGALAVPSVKDYEVNHPIVEKIAAVVTREDATLYWPHTVSTESLQVSILEGVNHYLAGADLDTALDQIQAAIDQARIRR